MKQFTIVYLRHSSVCRGWRKAFEVIEAESAIQAKRLLKDVYNGDIEILSVRENNPPLTIVTEVAK